MIVIKAITLGLFLFASQTAANICAGRWNGDQLPNSDDCGSFFVCNFGEPKLFKCLDNLLYDPVKRVCNWAYLVTCGQTSGGNQEHIPILPNPPYYPQPEIYPEDGHIYPGTPQSTLPHYNPTSAPTYTANPPPLVDNPNVPNYSQTTEFYPGLVESIPNVFHCTNPEFYFAPHPRSCEKYFICENYRIHSHQCGEGIHWDYVFNQCDFPIRTFCFAGPFAEGEGLHIDHIEHIISEPENIEEPVEEHVEEPVEEHVEDSVEGHVEEHVEEPVEEHVEEPVEEHVEEPVEEHVEEPIEEPVEEHVEEPVEEHVEEPVEEPKEPSTVEPSTAAPVQVIECPGRQAFIAHPTDCHKYYICIGGIPIVTSCPKKMAWDKDMAQCNEESWTECENHN